MAGLKLPWKNAIDTSLLNSYNNGDGFIRNFNTFEALMGFRAAVIPEKIYFKIGEVCELVGVQAHVLRYWETEFSMLSPQKNRSGQRSYRRRDVEIAMRIKELLYDEMFTIAGAKKKLQSELRETSKLKIVHPPERTPEPVEQNHARSVQTPGLFDDDLEINDIEIDEAVSERPSAITGARREALRTLAGHLVELRDMLNSGRIER
jgi:DNA-binding transcriptional MerR regulator